MIQIINNPEYCKIYDGSQLHPDFAYSQGAKGDSIVIWLAPAKVSEHLVDLEDLKNKDFIVSKSMLHMIITIQGNSITEAVLWQRLFMQTIYGWICSNLSGLSLFMSCLIGDDILMKREIEVCFRKLSVSIATVSPTKMLIHIGLNWKAEKAPVPTFDLTEFLTDDEDVARRTGLNISCEISNAIHSVRRASFKVSTF